MRKFFRNTLHLGAAALLGLACVGCNKDVSRNQVTEAKKDLQTEQKKAEEALANRDKAAAEYSQLVAKYQSQENKKDYERDMRTSLDQVKQYMDNLGTANKNQPEDVQKNWKIDYDHFKELYDRAEQRLKEVASAPAEDWTAAKRDANTAWSDVAKAYNDATRKYR